MDVIEREFWEERSNSFVGISEDVGIEGKQLSVVSTERYPSVHIPGGEVTEFNYLLALFRVQVGVGTSKLPFWYPLYILNPNQEREE